ncbi:unnamed protein product [Caenorhabditis auriculariae]|uniref:Nematode cuticle collagen N-terminal domain-containing protein n=1 Tax=Caenorhabditis auriculariae TaxID=2777116 RepID=A0A8S1HHN1_9PELO|nr:unnamed protein product [Caenorhabditis auriculariae]
MLEDPREKAYKAVAYSAVTFSFVAILSVCVSMPVVFNFVDSIHQQTKRDMSFCKSAEATRECTRSPCPSPTITAVPVPAKLRDQLVEERGEGP